MHTSSMENMDMLLNKYITTEYLKERLNPILVDFGSAVAEGQKDTYKNINIVSKFNYKGIDVFPGDNVDIVMKNPYVIPLENNYADVVISGQAFEHIEFFWVSFLELVRIVKKDSYIIIQFYMYYIEDINNKINKYEPDIGMNFINLMKK